MRMQNQRMLKTDKSCTQGVICSRTLYHNTHHIIPVSRPRFASRGGGGCVFLCHGGGNIGTPALPWHTGTTVHCGGQRQGGLLGRAEAGQGTPSTAIMCGIGCLIGVTIIQEVCQKLAPNILIKYLGYITNIPEFIMDF